MQVVVTEDMLMNNNMDTFAEQIVAIKRNGKTWLMYFSIALAAVILMTASFLFFKSIFLALDALIVWGAYKLYTMLSIEYEYIITNSTFDIDKIIAKSSRKRMVSLDISSVLRVEKYTGTLPSDIANNCLFACNEKDENAYFLVYKTEGKPQKTIIFAPNEKIKAAMMHFLPRHISENLK